MKKRLKIAVIHCGSDKAPKIDAIVEDIGYRVDPISMNNLLYAKLKAYDGVIISGAPILLSKEGTENYLPYFKGLDTYAKPVLGICFGHQILGALEDGTISLIEEDRSWQEITHEPHPLFEGLESPVAMMEDHCEVVLSPKNFSIIAHSKACENEAMIHQQLPRCGVQFHPETSDSQGQKLIANFLAICQEHAQEPAN